MANSAWNCRLSLLLISFGLVSQVIANGCTITMPTDIPSAGPVLLLSAKGVEEYQLFKPTGQTTTLPIGAKLLLSCPGRGNVIELVNVAELELTCSAGNVFKTSAGKQLKLTQLGCKAIPTSVLQATSEKCAGGDGSIFEAGFIFKKRNFVPVFSICYDNATENTFWTHNTLNGATINYSVPESTRRSFRAEGMKSSTTAVNKLYNINNQISISEKLFGKKQQYIIPNNQFMSRGHLTPDADMIFGYEQLATYFYINAAPEFQVVNAGNWIRCENLARSLAGKYGSDLEIYNGYMGTLELPKPTSPNTRVPIYLDDKKKLVAPLYYFKVIKHEPSDAAIVMITLNNPFATKADIDEFCPNVCDRAGVNSPIFADLTRGYTFCCELDEFKQHYDDLPSTLSATNLLSEPTEDVEDTPL